MKWNEHQRYRKAGDLVFDSKCRRARKPYWEQAILRKYIRPKALELGIEKNFGWNTSRHTYSTLLRIVGNEFKVMQELLWHFSAVNARRRYPSHLAGQAALVSLVFSSPAQTEVRTKIKKSGKTKTPPIPRKSIGMCGVDDEPEGIIFAEAPSSCSGRNSGFRTYLAMNSLNFGSSFQ